MRDEMDNERRRLAEARYVVRCTEVEGASVLGQEREIQRNSCPASFVALAGQNKESALQLGVADSSTLE